MTVARRLGAGGLVLIAAGLIACVAVGTALWRSRAPEIADAPAGPAGDVIGALERRMRGDTTDADGWRLLGWSYFQSGRYADAARAYRRATEIDPGKAQYWSALGEATVLAARAGVTPAAAAAFRRALAIDPSDPRARYFSGVERDVAGDHRGAIDLWIALLADAPPGAPWEPDVRRLVTQVAGANHVDIAERLPSASPAGPPSPPAAIAGAARAPTADAARLPPPARDTMVQAMVDRLAARLAADPHDSDGWIRLLRARMVLNDAAGARAALGTARATFRGDGAALARLAAAAKALGVPGA